MRSFVKSFMIVNRKKGEKKSGISVLSTYRNTLASLGRWGIYLLKIEIAINILKGTGLQKRSGKTGLIAHEIF